MIRNIIFDVGRVLVDFRWRETMEDQCLLALLAS